MKILQINNIHYHKGGADNVYFDTAGLLKKNGHDVYFFSSRGEKSEPAENLDYFYEEIDYRSLKAIDKIKGLKKFIFNDLSYKKLSDYINLIKPDIAHVHLFMGGATTSILKALNDNKIPVVHSVHDYRLICPNYLMFDSGNNICEKCIDGFYLRSFYRRCSQNKLSQSLAICADAYFRKYKFKPVDLIDHFIFVSHFALKKHIEFNIKYKDKSSLLYNFNKDLFSVKPSREKGNYFLFYGRLSREKGILTLVKAAIKAQIKLVIVGSGPLLPDLEKISSPFIEVKGFKSGKELWSFVRNSFFVIVPSEWYENNPLTIIESYTHGKPVIGSNLGGIPEIICNDDTGYLFSPGNLNELVDVLGKANALSGNEYKVMSKNARNFAEENFNPDKHYKKLLEIYNKTISLNL